MDRISTFGNSGALLTQALKVQAQVAEKQMETASSLKSQDYKGVASEAERIVSLEASLSRSMAYVDGGELAQGRIEAMQGSITSLIDLASNFKSELTAALGGENAEEANINGVAAGLLEEAASLINLQSEGRYLFGGGVSDQPPVEVSDPPYGAITSPSSSDESYYLGGEAQNSVTLSESLEVSYGVNGKNEGFEKLLRALNIAANASEDPMDQAAFEESFTLATEAIDALLVAQSSLSAAYNTIERAIDEQLDYQLYASNWIDDAKNVDLAEATTELSQLETQLEASYSATTKLLNLSLADYI